MKNKKLSFIIAVGLMAALCYVGNYLQIKIPNGVLITRVHLGNSMCLLAGILFGGPIGGLASGIGAMLFDLFNDYVLSAPYTFLSKFAMGYVAGMIAKSAKRLSNETVHMSIAAILGQLTYIVLYLTKTYITQLIIGAEAETALIAVSVNAITSTINAVLAVIISVPLYFALKKPLSITYFKDLVAARNESKHKWYVKLAVVVIFIAIAVGAAVFYAVKKG